MRHETRSGGFMYVECGLTEFEVLQMTELSEFLQILRMVEGIEESSRKSADTLMKLIARRECGYEATTTIPNIRLPQLRTTNGDATLRLDRLHTHAIFNR
jgi:hypothetical protein